MAGYQTQPPRGQPQQRQQQSSQQTQQRSASSREMPPTAGAGHQAPAIVLPKQKLFEKFGQRFGVDADLLVETLKKTCFRGQKADDPPITNEQLVTLLIVADQYNLNPFTKEIYAYPDKGGGIVPVVSVDGWIRIIQEHEQFAGMDMRVPEEMIEDTSGLEPKFKHKKCWEWFEVTIHRKDIPTPTPIVEFFDEVYRPPLWVKQGPNQGYYVPTPWQSHTKRMMRHKAIIQAGRVTFGFAGIYDDDEAERILAAQQANGAADAPTRPASHTQAAKEALRQRQGQTFEGTATRAQPEQTATPAQSREPSAADLPDLDDEFAMTGTRAQRPAAEPKQKPPELDKSKNETWTKLFKDASDEKTLDAAWDDCIAWHDEHGKEIDISVEAVYGVQKEKYEEARKQ